MGSRCTPPEPVIGRRFPQEGSVTFTENGGGVSREGFSEGCQQAAVPTAGRSGKPASPAADAPHPVPF